MNTTEVGALVFGLVVGYITYRTLMRTADKTAVSDLASVIGAIGGGAVTKLYEPASNSFAYYAFGLAVGMAVFFVLFLILNGKDTTAKVMGAERVRRGAGNAGGGAGQEDAAAGAGRRGPR
jgi:hypothetical protein